MSFTKFKQVSHHDYQEDLAITHVNISNKTIHMLKIANEAYRLSFAIEQKCTSLKLALG